MKDSRLGTFGVLTLVFNALLKFSLLRALPPSAVPAALILSSTFSRYFLCFFLLTDQYAGKLEQSKSHSVVAKSLNTTDFLFATLWTVIAWIILYYPHFSLLKFFTITTALLLSYFFLKLYFKNKLGGYTGDTLDAAEQIFEVIFLIFNGLNQK
ncbi:MAG: adenosylcobinamide-GDP ribazoletransferase [Oligoflexia bacterium]|nr:adenosylcobinamide-GDP ribazoletransferase [Oligoflexia bacterium]